LCRRAVRGKGDPPLAQTAGKPPAGPLLALRRVLDFLRLRFPLKEPVCPDGAIRNLTQQLPAGLGGAVKKAASAAPTRASNSAARRISSLLRGMKWPRWRNQ